MVHSVANTSRSFSLTGWKPLDGLAAEEFSRKCCELLQETHGLPEVQSHFLRCAVGVIYNTEAMRNRWDKRAKNQDIKEASRQVAAATGIVERQKAVTNLRREVRRRRRLVNEQCLRKMSILTSKTRLAQMHHHEGQSARPAGQQTTAI